MAALTDYEALPSKRGAELQLDYICRHSDAALTVGVNHVLTIHVTTLPASPITTTMEFCCSGVSAALLPNTNTRIIDKAATPCTQLTLLSHADLTGPRTVAGTALFIDRVLSKPKNPCSSSDRR